MAVFYRALLPAIWMATAAFASPMPVALAAHHDAQEDLLVRKGIELAQSRGLEKRLSADFSMEKTWDNEVLFGGSWSDVQEDGSESTALSITCLECYTTGTVTARLWEDLFHPTVKLEFSQVEAYVFLGVETNASGTYSINLFASQSPIGLGFPGLSVGVVFYVDLVFSLSAEIDLTGGFYVKLADSAYLETDIFGGDITDSFFDGISTKSIPVTVASGSATFKADLRLRVQCGAETSLGILGIGSGAVVGIYANIIEFVAVVDSTPDCALQTTEWWDLNAGAYAHLDVVVDYTTIGPVPTVSTTLLTAPTATQCWMSVGASTATPESGLTTATAVQSSPLYSTRSSATITTPSSSYQGSVSTVTSAATVPTATDNSEASPSTPTPPATSSVSLGASNSSYSTSNTSVATIAPSFSNDTLVTSTIYSTAVYTLTSCAASVVNCPASYQNEVIVTQTIDEYTTVCPATAQITKAPAKAPPETTALAPTTAVYMTTEEMVLLTPCATPITNTFVPPPSPTAPVLVAALATQGVTTAPGNVHASELSTAWSNTTGWARPYSGSTGYSVSSGGSSNSVSTGAPVTAGAPSAQRPLGLAVAGLLGLVVFIR